MPLERHTEIGDLDLDFELDLSPKKDAELKGAAEWKLVLDLSQWFLIQTAKVIMQIDDEGIPEARRAIVRRFWFERKTRVQVFGQRGWILVVPGGTSGARVIDFQLKSA
jgi:hypothetical protein